MKTLLLSLTLTFSASVANAADPAATFKAVCQSQAANLHLINRG